MATDFGFKATTAESGYYFISYNTEDADRVKDICRILNEQGLKIWYDEGIPHDSFWEGQISKKVRKCEEAIFFITKGIFEKAKELELRANGAKSADDSPFTYKEYQFAKMFDIAKLIVLMDKIIVTEDWPDLLSGWWVEINMIQGVVSVNESPEQTAKKILKELGLEYVEATRKRLYLYRKKTDETMELQNGTIFIGTNKKCQFCIKDNSRISGLHACLDVANNKMTLTDLGAVNHTYLNESIIKRKETVEVDVGDVIKLADEDFFILDEIELSSYKRLKSLV